MADTRTLKLSLLADVNKFQTGMKDAGNSTKGLKDKINSNSKKMVKAFGLVTGAVGLMAVAIGVDAVKAAAEDEVSQKKFRENLANTAGVIDETVVKSMDDYIERLQFTTGYSDGDLRDALGRLNVSTGDVATSQDILNVAMDTARGTGKPLAPIVDALAKAYDGNYTPLKKMGIKLGEAGDKSITFKDATKKLTDLFGGNAAAYADTYQGKLDIVNQRLGEFKEAAGKKLIDKLAKLLEQVNLVAMGFSGEDKDGLSSRARELKGDLGNTGAMSLGGTLKTLADAFGTLFAALSGDKAGEASSTLDDVASAVQTLADGINALAKAYGKIDAFTKSSGYQKTLDLVFGTDDGKFGSVLNPFGTNFLGAGQLVEKIKGSRAAGGPVMANQPYRVGEFGPEIFVPTGNGSIKPNAGNNTGNTFIFNGVLDAASARQSIERLLQTQSRISGPINLAGAMP